MKSKLYPYLVLYMPAKRLPVSLLEVKAFLDIDKMDYSDDTKLYKMIERATYLAERFMKRSLITQTWCLSYDGCLPSYLYLPRGPIQSVVKVRVVNRDNEEFEVPSSNYYLNSGKEKLVLDAAIIGHIIEVIYNAGYGDPCDVPDCIKEGILAHIGNLHDQNTEEELPKYIRDLYMPYRGAEIC